jgi:hypothetical protein
MRVFQLNAPASLSCIAPLLLLLRGCNAKKFAAQRSSPPPSPLSVSIQPRSSLQLLAETRQRATTEPSDTTNHGVAVTSLIAVVPRGGGGEDYSSAAQGLFGNIIGPASMLTGGLVPLGFGIPPLPKEHPRLKSVYSLVAVLSVANVILAIIYGTVSRNKLVEVPPEVASSVFELIRRDYELPWIGMNIHFIGSLCGFLIMIAIRAYILFPDNIRYAATGIVGSVLFLALSIIDRGISQGDGSGHQFGSGVIPLLARYVCLLWKEMVSSRSGPVEIGALLLFIGSVALAVRGAVVVETEKDTQQKKEA